jgi:RNA polymerase sigma factor (TIGR02999 family)
MNDITHILNAIEAGDPQAASQLLPMVYDELRKLAARKLADEKPGQTLDATALVHEAYVRLVGGGPPCYADRSHFFAVAAEAMRRILVDNARKKKSEKRGGQYQRVESLDNIEAPATPTDDLLAIDEALTLLAAEDADSAKLVKLRFYAGLSVEEAADVMGMARATAYRNWKYARAWLRRKLGGTSRESKP